MRISSGGSEDPAMPCAGQIPWGPWGILAALVQHCISAPKDQLAKVRRSDVGSESGDS